MKNKIKLVCTSCIIKALTSPKSNYVTSILYFFDNIYTRIIKVVKLLRGAGFCMIAKDDDASSKNITSTPRVISKILNKMENVRCAAMSDF